MRQGLDRLYALFWLLEKLVSSTDKNRVSLVSYKSLSSRKANLHRFATARIVSMNGALYALGASLTEDFRESRFLTNLAIHRIMDVTLTDKFWKIDMPEHDLATFGLPWHEPRIFRIKFRAGRAAQYVKERIWSDK